MTRRVLLLSFAILALALPARAGIDYGRMSQPDVMALLQLVQAEDWEALVVKGEPLAIKVEQAGDLNGVFFVNQQLWFGYFNLGRTREAARANARSKRAYYELVKDDPSMAELATVQLANAMVSEGQYDAAIKLVDGNLSRPDAQYRDQLAWQKAIALFLTDGAAAAASMLAADAAKAGGFASANEYLLAAEILDAETADRATVKQYGAQALKGFTPFVQGGTVQAGTRGDGSLLARAHAASGDYVGAIPLYQQYAGGFLKAATGGKEANQRQRYQLNAVLGFWEDRAGRPDAAIAHYREAVDALEKTWSKIKVQESKKSFMGQGQPMYVPRPARVYERLMRLLGQKKQAAETLELVESFKSRALVDLLARRVKPSTAGAELVAKERRLYRELEKSQRMNAASPPALVDAYGQVVEEIRKQDDEYAGSAIAPLRLKGTAVQKLLDDDTVLLEYFVGQEGTMVWIVTRKSVDMVMLGQGMADVERLVDAARRVLRKPGQEDKARAALDALSKAVLPTLPRAKRLVVVPHGPLHHVPFAALTEGGKYVVESRAVVHVPSASVLGWCARKNKRPADIARAPAIAFALGNTKPAAKGWDPLPGTLAEVKGLKGILPGLKVVEGSALRRDAVTKQAAGAKLVHFATHGSFDEGEPLDSCLILADSQLSVPEILELPLNAAWSVTLSACQTGLGRIEVGDDVVGLTRAFLYAGTPAVLSTLWKIADDPTARLMTDYYGGLAKGTRSDALRAAQLRMRKDAATAHPYFWAAFVITGDWR